MENKGRKKTLIGFIVSGILFIVFLVWTVCVCRVDKQEIGPNQSSVGLATMNGFFRDFIGNDMRLYILTDWLGLVPFGVAFGFAVLLDGRAVAYGEQERRRADKRDQGMDKKRGLRPQRGERGEAIRI